MMSVEENRKMVRRKNLLVSLLFLVMIAGVAGAAYYHNNLNKAKKTVEAQTKKLQELNDTLENKNARLDILVDSIIQFKKLLDSISRTPNYYYELPRIQKNLNNILQPVITGRNRDSARQHARDGYDKLNKNDFKGAMIEFEKSENFYKGYHESNQIHQLLKENEDKLGDREVQQQILIKIKQDYNSLQRLRQPQ